MNNHTINIKHMVLDADVTNPASTPKDSQKGVWNNRPMFPKGTRFDIETFDAGHRFGRHLDGMEGFSIRMVVNGNPSSKEVHLTGCRGKVKDMWKAIEPHLVEAPRTVQTILSENGVEAAGLMHDLLKKLVDDGTLTLDQVNHYVKILVDPNPVF